MIYVNGVSESLDAGTNAGTSDINSALSTQIGIRDTSSSPFDGLIDEVRVSSIVRPIEWVTATYNTCCDTFLTWGTLEYALVLRPNGAGSKTNIPSLTGAATHWQACSDASDSSYVYGTIADTYTNYEDRFTLANHTTETGTISSVDIYGRGKLGDASTQAGWYSMYYDSSGLGGHSNTIETSSLNLPTCPNTGLAWTWSDIDALTVGAGIFTNDDFNITGYVYDVWVVVNYTPAASGSVIPQAMHHLKMMRG